MENERRRRNSIINGVIILNYYVGSILVSDTLSHHGILGQKWGIRRFQNEDGSYTTAGKERRKQESAGSCDNSSKGLSSQAKKAIIAGAAVAAAGLTVYGLHRACAFDNLKVVKDGSNAAGNIIDFNGKDRFAGLRNLSNQAKVIYERSSGPSRIKESLQDSLVKANDLYGKQEGANNCVPSTIAGILRTMGYNVSAKGTAGKQINPGGAIEEVFKNAKVLDGSATRFGRSRDDAANMLLSRFGNNAKGLASIQWLGGNHSDASDGHAFGWIIENGKVMFADFQRGWGDSIVSSRFWKHIDKNGALTLARLDNADIDFEALRKYVNFN